MMAALALRFVLCVCDDSHTVKPKTINKNTPSSRHLARMLPSTNWWSPPRTQSWQDYLVVSAAVALLPLRVNTHAEAGCWWRLPDSLHTANRPLPAQGDCLANDNNKHETSSLGSEPIRKGFYSSSELSVVVVISPCSHTKRAHQQVGRPCCRRENSSSSRDITL